MHNIHTRVITSAPTTAVDRIIFVSILANQIPFTLIIVLSCERQLQGRVRIEQVVIQTHEFFVLTSQSPWHRPHLLEIVQ